MVELDAQRDVRLNVQRRAPEGTPVSPALIFTHGFGDSDETWEHQVEEFGARRETWSWDLLGHGCAGKPTDPAAYSRDAAVGHLDSVIERASGDVILVGHSLGGYLSLCRAVRDSARLAGLVLIATGPGFRDPASRDRWNRGIEKATERFGLAPDAGGIALQPDALVMDGLERVKLPVLQIAGSRDEMYHGGMRYLERKIEGVETLLVEGAGHHVHRSHAAPVNAAIERFAARVASPGTRAAGTPAPGTP